jgi:nucleoid DNA-binding protein
LGCSRSKSASSGSANPNKPEAEVIIPQRAVVKFKAGKILKQQLKKLDLSTLL